MRQRSTWGDRILVRHYDADGHLCFAEVGHLVGPGTHPAPGTTPYYDEEHPEQVVEVDGQTPPLPDGGVATIHPLEGERL